MNRDKLPDTRWTAPRRRRFGPIEPMGSQRRLTRADGIALALLYCALAGCAVAVVLW